MYRVSKALRTSTSPIRNRPATPSRRLTSEYASWPMRVRVVVLERAVEHHVGAAGDASPAPTVARVLQARAGRVVRRVRQLVALDVHAAREAARREARVRVADRREHVEAGRRPGADLELDALADGAADVGDVELRRHRRVGHVQLQVVPVDVEDGGIRGHAAVRPQRLARRPRRARSALRRRLRCRPATPG